LIKGLRVVVDSIENSSQKLIKIEDSNLFHNPFCVILYWLNNEKKVMRKNLSFSVIRESFQSSTATTLNRELLVEAVVPLVVVDVVEFDEEEEVRDEDDKEADVEDGDVEEVEFGEEGLEGEA
jgi:hypothetical protein